MARSLIMHVIDFENKEAILDLCARYKQTSATTTDTAPATNTNEAADPEASDCAEENNDREADAKPHDSQQLGSEVPLATAPEAEPRDSQQPSLEVPLETSLKMDLAATEGAMLSKHGRPTPSWHQRLRTSRVVDVTLGKSLHLPQPNHSLTAPRQPAIFVVLVLSRLLSTLGLQWAG